MENKILHNEVTRRNAQNEKETIKKSFYKPKQLLRVNWIVVVGTFHDQQQ